VFAFGFIDRGGAEMIFLGDGIYRTGRDYRAGVILRTVFFFDVNGCHVFYSFFAGTKIVIIYKSKYIDK